MTKTLSFHIHYRVQKDQRIVLNIRDENDKSFRKINLQSYDKENWFTVFVAEEKKVYHYLYSLIQSDKELRREGGQGRRIVSHHMRSLSIIKDHWKDVPRTLEVFLSNAFKDVILRRNLHRKSRAKNDGINTLRFSLFAPNIPTNYELGIVGSTHALGRWKKPLRLKANASSKWEVEFPVSSSIITEYKYVLCDKEGLNIVQWEDGDNRKIEVVLPEENNYLYVQNDEGFRSKEPLWRGSGIAIPVFSLRSEDSAGIGEFLDLKKMIDFAHSSAMNMVQILPVNDTIARKSWKDSYPYSAISVFALHPLYVNIERVGTFKKKKDQNAFLKKKKELNALDEVDFVSVSKFKIEFLRILFEENIQSLKENKDYLSFQKRNASWLKSYCIFCALRDHFKTADFSQWPKFQQFREKELLPFLEENNDVSANVDLYSFIQYHAHLQLQEASNYGRSKGIVLKGDLPIGVFRHSCDAWVALQLYNMNEQAGAPPDAYATLGQNWGFPTYNWAEMSENNFLWWRRRMIKLGDYFDALRIDHILGFFRIWQIPIDHVQGTMGLFNPRIPYSREEVAKCGIHGDLEKYTKPYIHESNLKEDFGPLSDKVIRIFFDPLENGLFEFKAKFSNQKVISSFLETSNDKDLRTLETAILSYMSEVLLIEEPDSNGRMYNPRITLQSTRFFKALDPQLQASFGHLYIEYFFHRHNEYWKKQAYWKLPALLEATNMFICGEDLGMIPETVPEVMENLNIMTLEIQRMSKSASAFGHTSRYPYSSVCSPSCHDMSTIRGWWTENKDLTQLYYNEYLYRSGEAPSECSGEIVESIVYKHLRSPSILAIFPLQDLLGINEELRREDPQSEQINVPANADHVWKYRMHLNLESLLSEKDFIDRIKNMVKSAGR